MNKACDCQGISVYVDKDNNLFSNPRAIDLSGITSNGLNVWDVLISPYDGEIIEEFLLASLKKSFSREIQWRGISPEEVLFKAKNWVQAVKKLKLVDILWNDVDGYMIFPHRWRKEHRGFFEVVSGKMIELGKAPPKGALAEAFLKAADDSIAAE